MIPGIEQFPRKEAELRQAFWEQLDSFADGLKISNCLQCGTCTGACPVSYAMDITPRQAIGLFRAGMIDEVLKSRTIWLCASCYSCTVRCPAGIKVTDTLYSFKRIAMGKTTHPRKFPVHILSRTFIDNIYRYGRNHELGLGLKYYLRSDIVKSFTSMGFGFRMIRRGRLAVLPKRIKRIREVRAIIERANQFGER